LTLLHPPADELAASRVAPLAMLMSSSGLSASHLTCCNDAAAPMDSPLYLCGYLSYLHRCIGTEQEWWTDERDLFLLWLMICDAVLLMDLSPVLINRL
jgi:hypothetical protein